MKLIITKHSGISIAFRNCFNDLLILFLWDIEQKRSGSGNHKSLFVSLSRKYVLTRNHIASPSPDKIFNFPFIIFYDHCNCPLFRYIIFRLRSTIFYHITLRLVIFKFANDRDNSFSAISFLAFDFYFTGKHIT